MFMRNVPMRNKHHKTPIGSELLAVSQAILVLCCSVSLHGLEPAVRLVWSVEHCASDMAVMAASPTLGTLFLSCVSVVNVGSG